MIKALYSECNQGWVLLIGSEKVKMQERSILDIDNRYIFESKNELSEVLKGRGLKLNKYNNVVLA